MECLHSQRFSFAELRQCLMQLKDWSARTGASMATRPLCTWAPAVSTLQADQRLCSCLQRPSFTELRQHLTQLFKDLQQRRQRVSNEIGGKEPVQFHSHATVPVKVAGGIRKRGEVPGSV